MKVGELREKLNKMNKQEVIKLAAEFYKLIPKAKKEDYGLDEMINNPNDKAKTPKRGASQSSLIDVELEIKEFIEHAEADYYYAPNRVVSKKERSKWRFKVKKWYKELNNFKRADADLKLQCELQTKLYNLMCKACYYMVFTTDDPFRSIGIDQEDYLRSVLTLIQETEGKVKVAEKGISLAVFNPVDRYSLPSQFMEVLIEFLDIPDLKYKAIEAVKHELSKVGFKPSRKQVKNGGIIYDFDTSNFKLQRRHNNLVEFVLRLYLRLHEPEEGIAYYHQHYHQSSDEVKLYVLVDILMRYQQKELIQSELQKAIDKGLALRQKLMNLLNTIETTGKLPQYM